MTVCKYRYKSSWYKFITTLYKITTTMLPQEVVPQRTYKTLETETHRAKYFGKLNYILFQPIESLKKNKEVKEKFLNYMNMELISNIKTFRRKTY